MANPSGLTVQLGLLTSQVRILPQTTVIVAKSAEAEVEGLLPGDYVLINLQRRSHLMTARRLTYDVQPFFPMKSYSGAILRQSADQKRFLVRLVTNRNLWFRTSARLTRYEVDGKLQSTVPLLTKGEDVEILTYRLELNWVAVDVNVTSQANHAFFSSRSG